MCEDVANILPKAGADLEGGPRCLGPSPSNFEKCPFYFVFLGFLQIDLVPFLSWTPPSEKLDLPQKRMSYNS